MSMSKKSGSENLEVKRFVGLDANGYEHPDPTPVEVPTRLRIPQRQVDRIRDIIRRELSVAAQSEGWETFDEADDFEVEGEDPISPYEEVFEPPSSAAEQPEPPGAAPASAAGAVDKKRVVAQGAVDAKPQPDGVVASKPDPRDG